MGFGFYSSEELTEKMETAPNEWKAEFYQCIKDIAEHPVVLRMKLYKHHGTSSCYQHCMNVAYHNYCWCRFLNLEIGGKRRDDPRSFSVWLAYACCTDRRSFPWLNTSQNCLQACSKVLSTQWNWEGCHSEPYVAGDTFADSKDQRGLDHDHYR